MVSLLVGCAPADDEGTAAAFNKSVCQSNASCAAAEARTAARLEGIRNDPDAVAAFVRGMPKGGDLHHHLSGAVYAETYLEWAQADGGYCIAPNLASSTSCGADSTAVPRPGDPLYGQVIASWSMEGFQPSATESGHDHFFATFSKFGALSGVKNHGRSLADVMKRADAENELYIEMMLHSNGTARNAGTAAWSAGHGSTPITPADFAAFRQELLAGPTWNASVNSLLGDVANTETEARTILGCDQSPVPSPCRVKARFEAYISRSGEAAGVFAQMVAAYEAAKRDDRVVALNLVGPEDGVGALKPYDLQMQMLDYLHGAYAGESPLRLSLHAGELAPRYMPAGWEIGSLDHIRKAVEVAHADRIGHGLDVMLESDPEGLLRTLKERNILVEVCLSSNIQILEISGKDHPLAKYLEAGVPIALATDDQGVSRSSIATEFTRAVLDQKLAYGQLKTLARNSLEYSFIPGASLWAEPNRIVDACAEGAAAGACDAFLASSPRAATQWELEQRFRLFESAP